MEFPARTRSLRRRAQAVPAWLRLGYGVAVPVIAVVYWHVYGPQNYLWLSDIALALTAMAVWTASRMLASMAAVGMLAIELAWVVDFLTGGRLLGMAAYMYDAGIPLYLRLLSSFHLALPPTVIYLLHRFGYDPRALIIQVPVVWAAFLGAYGLTEREENINWVFGPHEHQDMVPPPVYLAFVMVVYPLAVMLPMHVILKRLFPPKA